MRLFLGLPIPPELVKALTHYEILAQKKSSKSNKPITRP